MNIETTLTLLKNADCKDYGSKLGKMLVSHGYTDHSVDINEFFISFVDDENAFTQSEKMPKEWKSDRSYAAAFDALQKCLTVAEIKQHLLNTIGTEQYHILKTRFDELTKQYNRKAKQESKKNKKEEVVQDIVTTNHNQEETMDDVETTISNPNDDVEEFTNEISESDVEPSEGECMSVQFDDYERVIKQLECAMRFIWDLGLAETDPVKKVMLKSLHRSIMAIGAPCKQMSSHSSSE